jgi:hypothetical protein
MMERLAGRVALRIGKAIEPPPVPPPVQGEVDAMWRDALGKLDRAAVRDRFLADGEFIVVPELVPRAFVTRALAEIDTANPTRSSIPWFRAAQHVGWRALQRVAPLSTAIYRSAVFVDWMTELVGKPMQLKHPSDDHACATYEYTRAGDHMRFHYDTCGCDDGASYSQLLSLHDRSTQRLLVDLHTRDGLPVERRSLATPAGTLTVFCGSKVWHAVTPLGPGERRVILSMSYATDPSMPPWRWLFENVKDAVLYFGPASLLRGGR